MKRYGISDRQFGVEFEVIPKAAFSIGDIKTALIDAGFKVRSTGYQHTAERYRYWTIKPDVSLSNGGFEIVSPILKGREGLDAVKEMATILGRYCEINSSCGFHVHHEATGFNTTNLKIIYQAYQAAQAVLASEVLARNRANNQYCQPLPEGGSLVINRIRHLSRYHAVNFRAFHCYGTIEFRQFQGTVDAEKAVAWVIFTQGLMEYAASVKTVCKTPAKSFKNVVENRLFIAGEEAKQVMKLVG